MAFDNDGGCAVVFESAHRPKPSFESAVITLDTIVSVLLSVVERIWHQVFNDGFQRLCQIGDDLVGLAMRS